MKYLLISLLFFIYGCSTEPELDKTTKEPELDKTTKESTGSWTIRRLDGEEWIDTADKLTVYRTWRFISYLELDDERVQIKGGYTITLTNPNNYDVVFEFSRVIFVDRHDIPIYIHEFSIIRRTVSANGTDMYLDNFEIYLDNIDIANEITKMTIWATADRSTPLNTIQ